MKTFVSTLLTTFFWAAIISNGFAQSEQLNREIRIAESILNEIFSDVTELNAGFPFDEKSSVKGEYVPGAGVHFSVGENYFTKIANMSGSISIKEDKGPERSITFDREDTGERLDESEIEDRIDEYITGYASQLRSIKDDEELRITFGLSTNTNRWVSVFQSPKSDSLSEGYAAISKQVSGRELRRVREEGLSSARLLERVETVKIPLDEQPRDLEIFSSILETAIRGLDLEGMRVNRNVKSNYIPGWGVRYYISASSKGGGMFGFLSEANQKEIETDIDTAFSFNFDSDSLDFDMEEFETNNEDVKAMLDSLDISSSLSEKIDSLVVALPKLMDSLAVALPKMMEGVKTMFESVEVPGDEVLMADMELLQSEIKEIVKNYGATLSTLQDGELLMINMSWRGRSTTLPERKLYYISKKDLMASRDLQSVEL